MGLVNMNLLNILWKTGIKPIKNSIAEKLDASKAANNLLTTEEGFYLDARQGPEIVRMIEEQNSNLSELIGAASAFDFEIVTATKEYTLSANRGSAIFVYPSIPAGYEAVAIKDYYTGSDYVYAMRVTCDRMDIKNTSSSTINSAVSLSVLCVKKI